MASIPHTPTYFLAPDCDFPPDGLIALGSIIVNPKTPQKSLNHRNNKRVAVPIEDLQEAFQDNWENIVKYSRHGKVTIWASFLQMVLGLGTDVGWGLEQGRQDLCRFSRLETRYFEPSTAYIEESLKGEGVQAYISATRYRKPIYMVTGVKIARGASVTGRTVKKHEGTVKAGFDATVLMGVPVSGGPLVEMSSSTEREVKFDNCSDYVFAYRVIKVRISKKGNVKRHKDFITGALLSMDERTCNKGNFMVCNWGVENLVATSEELKGSDIVSNAYEDGEDDIVVTVKP